LVAASVLLSSLIVVPCPWPPTWTTSAPIASNAGRARSKAASGPPAMIVSVPSSAFGREPVTGASRKSIPRSASRAAIARLPSAAIVDMSTTRPPSPAPSAAPSSPSRTASTSAVSGTIEIVMSAAAAASAGVAATSAPCSDANDSARSRVRFQTVTSKPAPRRFAAIGLPMIPSPRNATRI
jgi:hypothetical protein